MTNTAAVWMSPQDAGLNQNISAQDFAKVVTRIDVTEGLFNAACLNHIACHATEWGVVRSQEILLSGLKLTQSRRERIVRHINATTRPFVLMRPQLMEAMKCIALQASAIPYGCIRTERDDDFLKVALYAGEFQARNRNAFLFTDRSLDARSRLITALPALRDMCRLLTGTVIHSMRSVD